MQGQAFDVHIDPAKTQTWLHEVFLPAWEFSRSPAPRLLVRKCVEPLVNPLGCTRVYRESWTSSEAAKTVRVWEQSPQQCQAELGDAWTLEEGQEESARGNEIATITFDVYLLTSSEHFRPRYSLLGSWFKTTPWMSERERFSWDDSSSVSDKRSSGNKGLSTKHAEWMSDKPSLKLLLVSPSSRNVESITHGKRWEGTTRANSYANTDRDEKEDILLYSNVNCNAKNASFLSESLVVIKQAFASCSSRFRRAFVFEEEEDRGDATCTHGKNQQNYFEERKRTIA